MKKKNIADLEKLSVISHICGMFSIFFGIGIIVLDLIAKDYAHIQSGIFVLSTGYAFTKISAKIASVIYDEKSPTTGY